LLINASVALVIIKSTEGIVLHSSSSWMSVLKDKYGCNISPGCYSLGSQCIKIPTFCYSESLL
jgi:hypothetical protein